MRKNKAVSAVIGVILMVAITVAIAATVFVYVNDLMNKEKEPVKETFETKTIEYGKALNWSAYQSDCMYLVIDWDSGKLVCERDGWCSVPATWEKQCTGPWDDRSTWAYFNTATGATHVESATDTSDYLQELVNINIQIRDLLKGTTKEH